MTDTVPGGFLDYTNHRIQSVAPGRTQMLVETDLANEIRRRRDDVGGWLAAIDANQYRDQAGNDGRIADRLKLETFRILLGLQPDLGLASMYPVYLGAPVIGKFRQILAEVDDVLVSIDPVIEETEFLDQIRLCQLNLGHK